MLKSKLDNYVEQYETKDFIKNDPVQFVHKFKNKNDIEIDHQGEISRNVHTS